jgi:diguanylate cyclase (GGDEF)-like protein
MMTRDRAHGEGFVHLFSRPGKWAIWSLNRPAVLYIVSVIIAASSVTGLEVGERGDFSAGALIRFAFLLAAGVGYTEAFDRVERIRRFLGDDSVRSNHLSVWTIAGVLALPPALACILVPCLYAHVLLISRRHKSARVHRMVFTGAAATLATAIVAELVHRVPGSGHVGNVTAGALTSLIAVPGFLVIDTLIVITGVYLAMRPPSFKTVVPKREVLWFELATEVLGVVTGQLVMQMPWLVPASAGGLVVLHRAALVKDLELAATTDPKTALLTVGAWRDRAVVAMARARAEAERIAIVVIDLDHFKRINDVHGHLVGDRVLGDVGKAIRDETRARDIVGRFGGEEFVVLIDGRAAAAHAIDIATRIRERIASLTYPEGMRVTATIGVAYGVPSEAISLERLIAQADAALYEGKSAGRDRINALALS